MPKKNRAYKKGESHRDARLFVIVAEGEREDAYFRWFNERNQRIKVKVVPREENKSAPTHFLSRVEKFIEEGEWSEKENDRLWFVLDVDRWSREEIENLRVHCQQHANWGLGISNPCFEVWLVFHFLVSIPDEDQSCTDLKRRVAELIKKEGHLINAVCPLLATAVQNARQADGSDGDFPDAGQTKLYRLGEQMLELLGNNWV